MPGECVSAMKTALCRARTRWVVPCSAHAAGSHACERTYRTRTCRGNHRSHSGQLRRTEASALYNNDAYSYCKKGERSGTCAFYMSQTRDQKRFTVSEVAADWHELMIP